MANLRFLDVVIFALVTMAIDVVVNSDGPMRSDVCLSVAIDNDIKIKVVFDNVVDHSRPCTWR